MVLRSFSCENFDLWAKEFDDGGRTCYWMAVFGLQ